jgi:hypothetical protein
LLQVLPTLANILSAFANVALSLTDIGSAFADVTPALVFQALAFIL